MPYRSWNTVFFPTPLIFRCHLLLKTIEEEYRTAHLWSSHSNGWLVYGDSPLHWTLCTQRKLVTLSHIFPVSHEGLFSYARILILNFGLFHRFCTLAGGGGVVGGGGGVHKGPNISTEAWPYAGIRRYFELLSVFFPSFYSNFIGHPFLQSSAQNFFLKIFKKGVNLHPTKD